MEQRQQLFYISIDYTVQCHLLDYCRSNYFTHAVPVFKLLSDRLLRFTTYHWKRAFDHYIGTGFRTIEFPGAGATPSRQIKLFINAPIIAIV